MNHWEPVDGTDDELTSAADGMSVVVQAHFPSARVVKSLNQLGYHEFDEVRRPAGAPDRVAMGAAGDDRLAVRTVMRMIDDLGFDAVDAGPLANGKALEPDGSPFALTYTARELAQRLAAWAGTRAAVISVQRGTPLVHGARDRRAGGSAPRRARRAAHRPPRARGARRRPGPRPPWR